MSKHKQKFLDDLIEKGNLFCLDVLTQSLKKQKLSYIVLGVLSCEFKKNKNSESEYLNIRTNIANFEIPIKEISYSLNDDIQSISYEFKDEENIYTTKIRKLEQ